MNDDKLQGILFSQSLVIDLVPYKRHQQLYKAMLAKKQILQKRWKRAFVLDTSNHYVVSGTRRREAEISELVQRLKPRHIDSEL